MPAPILPLNPDRPLDAFRLDGKVAVVIGGTGTLCGMMARALAGAGARVVVAGRDAAKAPAVLDPIRAAGGTAEFIACDACKKADLQAMLDATLAKFGRCDILVNGAGTNSPTPFLDIGEDELNRIVQINYVGTVLACQVFGKHFTEVAAASGRGASIINLGSASGLTPLSRVFTYSATKAAVHNLSKNLAREWAPLGVRVNILVPGFIPAEQNRKVLTPERVQSIMGHTPMKRFGEPAELTGATLLLASDAGAFITGAELVVDGGFNCCTI